MRKGQSYKVEWTLSDLTQANKQFRMANLYNMEQKRVKYNIRTEIYINLLRNLPFQAMQAQTKRSNRYDAQTILKAYRSVGCFTTNTFIGHQKLVLFKKALHVWQFDSLKEPTVQFATISNSIL